MLDRQVNRELIGTHGRAIEWTYPQPLQVPHPNIWGRKVPQAPRRRSGTQVDASAVTAVHRRMSFATRSNDDIDWPVHSMTLPSTTYAVYLCDAFPLRRSPVV